MSVNLDNPIFVSIIFKIDFLDSLSVSWPWGVEEDEEASNESKHAPRNRQATICTVSGTPALSLALVAKSTTK
jgi:hypothetical protein